MILKRMDPKEDQIAALERLAAAAPAGRRLKIEQELRMLRAGINAEREAAYLIDFDYKSSPRTMVLHDLRLDVNGRVAQIDHILIHWTLNVFVLETKCFHAGIKITENGEFLVWNDYKKNYEGMPSPLAQNDRHIAVLKDAFDKIGIPSRLGMRLSPVFHSLVLVSPKARIARPQLFDTSRIIKADMLKQTVENILENGGIINDMANVSRLVSKEAVRDIGRRLRSLHRKASFNYAAKFGLSECTAPQERASIHHAASLPCAHAAARPAPHPTCRACRSEHVKIRYGRYGYYFKCLSCSGNTPIIIHCGKCGQKEGLHKDGPRFYRECPVCKTRSLFFTNPDPVQFPVLS